MTYESVYLNTFYQNCLRFKQMTLDATCDPRDNSIPKSTGARQANAIGVAPSYNGKRYR